MKQGWDGLAAIEVGEAAKAQAAEADDRLASSLAYAYAATFSTDTGRRVLAHLRAVTLEARMLPDVVIAGEPVTSAECVPFVAFREGQNNVVEMIERMIETVNETRS